MLLTTELLLYRVSIKPRDIVWDTAVFTKLPRRQILGYLAFNYEQDGTLHKLGIHSDPETSISLLHVY